MDPECPIDRRMACRLVFGMAAAAMLPGCGATPRAIHPRRNEVWMVNGMFVPVERDVTDGTRVTWINRDSVPHTVTSGVNHYDDEFDSGVIPPGGTFCHTFRENGVFSYFCSRYPGTMRAAVVVGVGVSRLPF